MGVFECGCGLGCCMIDSVASFILPMIMEMTASGNAGSLRRRFEAVICSFIGRLLFEESFVFRGKRNEKLL